VNERVTAINNTARRWSCSIPLLYYCFLQGMMSRCLMFDRDGKSILTLDIFDFFPLASQKVLLTLSPVLLHRRKLWVTSKFLVWKMEWTMWSSEIPIWWCQRFVWERWVDFKGNGGVCVLTFWPHPSCLSLELIRH
jgi:hypothetical protein